jgi:hypothetical protein
MYVYTKQGEIGTRRFEEPTLRYVELHCFWGRLTEGVEIVVEVVVRVIPEACGGFDGGFVFRSSVGGGSEHGDAWGACWLSLWGGEDLGV